MRYFVVASCLLGWIPINMLVGSTFFSDKFPVGIASWSTSSEVVLASSKLHTIKFVCSDSCPNLHPDHKIAVSSYCKRDPILVTLMVHGIDHSYDPYPPFSQVKDPQFFEVQFACQKRTQYFCQLLYPQFLGRYPPILSPKKLWKNIRPIPNPMPWQGSGPQGPRLIPCILCEKSPKNQDFLPSPNRWKRLDPYEFDGDDYVSIYDWG